jgi:hypothetical protein
MDLITSLAVRAYNAVKPRHLRIFCFEVQGNAQVAHIQHAPIRAGTIVMPAAATSLAGASTRHLLSSNRGDFQQVRLVMRRV